MHDIDVTIDTDNLTLTATAEFDVPVQRLWDAYADPHQLGHFWGPPGWPAEFSTFDYEVGGLARYKMHGPEGATAAGRWEFTDIEPPLRFSVIDSFENDEGEVNADLPSMPITFEFAATDHGSRITSVGTFASREDLDQVVQMGVVDGTRAAMSQIIDVLVRH